MQKSIRRFRGDSTLRAWLLGIANNQCMSLARKNRRESAPLEEWLEVKGNDPTNSIVDREELRKALLKLSQEHRDVVLMHEIEGLKYAEIAGVLGIPEGTVKSRLHHAFRSLRQSLVGAMS
jgi:RNA polymerase sigma-70 factor (ECF subfamily)